LTGGVPGGTAIRPRTAAPDARSDNDSERGRTDVSNGEQKEGEKVLLKTLGALLPAVNLTGTKLVIGSTWPRTIQVIDESGPKPVPVVSITLRAPVPGAQWSGITMRLLLAFTPAAFERRFVAHYVATYLRYAQVSLVLGMVLVFGDLDGDGLSDLALGQSIGVDIYYNGNVKIGILFVGLLI
jgi:hypothetical protein